MNRKYNSLYERIVANTELEHEDNPQSCWLWTGGSKTRDGYPRLSVRIPGRKNPVPIRAARAILEEVLDATFPFDEAGHLCFNPGCCNPDHLEVQTYVANLAERRGYRAPQGSWIPVLFPREDMYVPEWDACGEVAAECPF